MATGISSHIFFQGMMVSIVIGTPHKKELFGRKGACGFHNHIVVFVNVPKGYIGQQSMTFCRLHYPAVHGSLFGTIPTHHKKHPYSLVHHKEAIESFFTFLILSNFTKTK